MDTNAISSRCFWGIFFVISSLWQVTFSDVGKLSSSSVQNHLSSTSAAYFTTKNNTKVIAQKGGLAILPCVVNLNSPATVSWIRRRDFQLLTVGLSTYSSDVRFSVEHTRHMSHWSLRIKSIRAEDQGLYECQLSIYPTQSIFVELKVVEAIAEILEPPDLHIDEGSTLKLECTLKRATENPAFVFWYHNNKMINYDLQDGFYVSSLQSTKLLATSGLDSNNFTNSTNTLSSHYLPIQTISVLTIKEVCFYHAGNYTCAPSNAKLASIIVHVLRGEQPAAIQHTNRTTIEEGKSKSYSFQCERWHRQPLGFLMIFRLIYIYHDSNR